MLKDNKYTRSDLVLKADNSSDPGRIGNAKEAPKKLLQANNLKPEDDASPYLQAAEIVLEIDAVSQKSGSERKLYRYRKQLMLW